MKLIQIALWNGLTIGAGVGLSLPASIKVATDKTSFCMPGISIAFVKNFLIIFRSKNWFIFGYWRRLSFFQNEK